MDSADLIALETARGAHNYHPLPVVVESAEGAWVTDVEGRKYLDFLSAYSALNFGHRHPRVVAAAMRQLGRVTLTSRAVHSDQLGPFCAELADLVGLERVLPMNSGAEAVESAIKTARAWGYRIKGVPDGQAKIIVARDNFHGRTTTIISFSDDPVARRDFGPYTAGFVSVSYGDLEELRSALADPDVVGFLVEPIQGEAGVVVPPAGYLAAAAAACREAGVLFIADEIQSGLGRTGATLACDWEEVVADVVLLGKALGGGILPVSAVVCADEVQLLVAIEVLIRQTLRRIDEPGFEPDHRVPQTDASGQVLKKPKKPKQKLIPGAGAGKGKIHLGNWFEDDDKPQAKAVRKVPSFGGPKPKPKKKP